MSSTHWSAPSNMYCNKISQNQEEVTCYEAGFPYINYEYSKNFFLNNKCPNLILGLNEKDLAECTGKTIVVKLKSPLIIADYNNNIIDKDGNNTGIKTYMFKAFLNSDGATMRDCGSNVDCQKYAKMMDKILWTSDKEIKLTIPGAGKGDQKQDNQNKDVQEGSDTYFSESESMALLNYSESNDLM